MNFVTYADLTNDVLAMVNDWDVHSRFCGVVGIPRSGMIPASIIATRYNLPLTDIDHFLSSGGRFYPSRMAGDWVYANGNGRNILLIDDSIHAGSTMQWAIREIERHTTLCERAGHICPVAVYGTGNHTISCGVYKKIEQPRVFEWNWTRHKIIEDAFVDLDGILCYDPPDGLRGNDFKSWALQVKPRFVPSRKIRAIVSNRVEEYRTETEIWLKSQGIEYQELRLIQGTEEERDKNNLAYNHKYARYDESESKLFIESDLTQANLIHSKTRKSVLCVDRHGKCTMLKR